MNKVSKLTLLSTVLALTACGGSNSVVVYELPDDIPASKDTKIEDGNVSEQNAKRQASIEQAVAVMENNLKDVTKGTTSSATKIDTTEYDTVVAAYLGETGVTNSNLDVKRTANSRRNAGTNVSSSTALDNTFTKEELRAIGLTDSMKKYYLAQIYGIFLKMSTDENATKAKENQAKITNALKNASSATIEKAEKFLTKALVTAVAIFVPEQAKEILYETTKDENGNDIKVEKDFSLETISSTVSENSEINLDSAMEQLDSKNFVEETSSEEDVPTELKPVEVKPGDRIKPMNFNVKYINTGIEWDDFSQAKYKEEVKFSEDGKKIWYTLNGTSCDGTEIITKNPIEFNLSDMKNMVGSDKYLTTSVDGAFYINEPQYTITYGNIKKRFTEEEFKDFDFDRDPDLKEATDKVGLYYLDILYYSIMNGEKDWSRSENGNFEKLDIKVNGEEKTTIELLKFILDKGTPKYSEVEVTGQANGTSYTHQNSNVQWQRRIDLGDVVIADNNDLDTSSSLNLSADAKELLLQIFAHFETETRGKEEVEEFLSRIKNGTIKTADDYSKYLNKDYVDFVLAGDDLEDGRTYKLEDLEILYEKTPVFNSKFTLVLADPEKTELSYTNFGYIAIDDGIGHEEIGHVSFIYGGFDENKVEFTKNAFDGKTVFKGNAVGYVLSDDGDESLGSLKLDGSAELTVEPDKDMKQTLVAKFGNWYDVTAEGDKLSFDSTGKTIAPVFNFDAYTPEDNDTREGYDKAQHINQHLNVEYYGVDGKAKEATGSVTGYYVGKDPTGKVRLNGKTEAVLSYGFAFGAKK